MLQPQSEAPFLSSPIRKYIFKQLLQEGPIVLLHPNFLTVDNFKILNMIGNPVISRVSMAYTLNTYTIILSMHEAHFRNQILLSLSIQQPRERKREKRKCTDITDSIRLLLLNASSVYCLILKIIMLHFNANILFERQKKSPNLATLYFTFFLKKQKQFYHETNLFNMNSH